MTSPPGEGNAAQVARVELADDPDLTSFALPEARSGLADALDRRVRRYPWLALLLVAGVAFLLGRVLRR
jgi:hypothetical protein